MSEDVYDRWHASRPDKYIEKLKAKGDPIPEPCACKPGGLLPTVDHGCENRWQARWRDKDGQQRYKNFPKNRKTAAAAYQRSQRAAVAEGREPFTHRGRATKVARVPTFGQYVETFLAAHEGRDGTVETYGYRLRPHVVPVFGARPLDDIKRREWREFFAALKRGGMADSTRSGIKKSVSALYGMAVEDEYLEGNPVAGLRLPQGDGREVRLTWAHVVALAEEITPRYELLIWYGALQALRSMEATGVRQADMLVDLDEPVQLVEEQRRRGKAAPLKTDASKAPLHVGSFLVEKYRAHMLTHRAPLPAARLRKRERRGSPPIPEEYQGLVTVTRTWTPVHENTLCSAFNDAKARARARGVDVPEEATFRDLRHFADAVLTASGLEPRKVQARMRHGRIDETMNTYGYLLWRLDWENAPASFEELYGIPASEAPSLPPAALIPAAERGTGLAPAPAER